MNHEESQTFEYRHLEQCEITEYLYILNTSTKTIQGLKKTDNYSKYTKVLENQV